MTCGKKVAVDTASVTLNGVTLKPPETRHIRDDPFGHRFRVLANTSEREHYKTN